MPSQSILLQAGGLRGISLADFDLSPVTRRLLSKGHSNATELETEFRRLANLWLTEENIRLVPSEPVDLYWHELVLDTQLYQRFCKEVFGRFVHHVPDDGDEAGRTNGYSHTLKLYQEHFGPAPEAFWPNGFDAIGVPRAAGHCGGGSHCGN